MVLSCSFIPIPRTAGQSFYDQFTTLRIKYVSDKETEPSYNIDDVSEVKKYEISEEDYLKRPNNLRDFKKKTYEKSRI